MSSFKRSLLGYRRAEVDEALAARDERASMLWARTADQGETIERLEGEAKELFEMVLEREREIRDLGARLREAQECHERNIGSLEAISVRLEDMGAQARGQATRIRMKALREAVEVSKRVKALTDAVEPAERSSNGASTETPPNGRRSGEMKLEIGPLGDFSQLVGFEEAVGRAGASAISVERFSEGRATLSMRLDEPVDLVSELESLAELDFTVRHNAPGNLVLDIEDEDGEQRAA